jgi:hypothetical protein
VKTVVLDTTSPPAPGVQLVRDADGTWNLTTSRGTTLTCSLTGPGGATTPVSCQPGVLTVALERLGPGTWTLTVRATDEAGNASEATSTTFEVAAPAQPQPQPLPVEPDAVVEEATPPPPIVEALLAAAVTPLPPTVEGAARLALAEVASVRALQRLRAPGGLSSRWRDMLRVLGSAATVGGIPLLLLLLVMLFLAMQDRIDRNDPKLALAPVHSHQELPFRPVERRLA